MFDKLGCWANLWELPPAATTDTARALIKKHTKNETIINNI